MREPKALVRNAADSEQVRKGKDSERFTAEAKIKRTLVVGSTYEGRQFLWEMVGDCGVHESIMQTNAMIYYNAGRQDVGHKWMDQIIGASPELWLKCQSEAFDRARNITEPEGADPNA